MSGEVLALTALLVLLVGATIAACWFIAEWAGWGVLAFVLLAPSVLMLGIYGVVTLVGGEA